jgi:hypothetical protein
MRVVPSSMPGMVAPNGCGAQAERKSGHLPHDDRTPAPSGEDPPIIQHAQDTVGKFPTRANGRASDRSGFYPSTRGKL